MVLFKAYDASRPSSFSSVIIIKLATTIVTTLIIVVIASIISSQLLVLVDCICLTDYMIIMLVLNIDYC